MSATSLERVVGIAFAAGSRRRDLHELRRDLAGFRPLPRRTRRAVGYQDASEIGLGMLGALSFSLVRSDEVSQVLEVADTGRAVRTAAMLGAVHATKSMEFAFESPDPFDDLRRFWPPSLELAEGVVAMLVSGADPVDGGQELAARVGPFVRHIYTGPTNNLLIYTALTSIQCANLMGQIQSVPDVEALNVPLAGPSSATIEALQELVPLADI